MKLILDGVAGSVRVEDAEELTSLSLELRDLVPGQVPALPADLGRIEGEHAFLDIDALRALVPARRSCSWDGRFGQAMAQARRSGWTDPTGSLVRAPITTKEP